MQDDPITLDETANLEKLRLKVLADNKKLKIMMVIIGMIAVALIIYFIVFLADFAGLIGVLIFIIASIFIGVLYYLTTRNKDQYKTQFRAIVVKRLWQNADPSISYIPNQYISKEQFNSSHLYGLHATSYGGENFITKHYENFSLSASELEVYTKSSGQNSQRRRLFAGIFLVFTLPNPMQGRTLIVKDKTQGILGFLGGLIQTIGYFQYKRLQFNDAYFETYFQIYSTAEEETKRLVDKDVVEKLMELRLTTGPAVLSFTESFMFVAIEKSPPFFNIQPETSLSDELNLRQYMDEVKKYQEYIDHFIPVMERLTK